MILRVCTTISPHRLKNIQQKLTLPTLLLLHHVESVSQFNYFVFYQCGILLLEHFIFNVEEFQLARMLFESR